jgi:GAF domain-containing protein
MNETKPPPADETARALDEFSRLAAVEILKTVDVPVDDITAVLEQLAERLGGVPLAAATYLDGKVQHFIATNQGPREDLDRGVSHCQYVIGTGAFVCIQDASMRESGWSKLKRSLLNGEPLAAYLGFPLRFAGEVVGAVCAIDTNPRVWTADEHFAVYRAGVTIGRMLERAAGTLET